MPLLTDARRSVWTAIDNWPDLDGAFRRKYRFDKSQDSTSPPQPQSSVDRPQCIQDFPALTIKPARIKPEWMTNQTRKHPYALECGIWTLGWDSTAENETLWEKIVDAIFNYTADGQTISEVRRRSGQWPSQPSPGSFAFGRMADRTVSAANQDGGIPFILHTFGIQLNISYQPIEGSS